MRVLGTNRRKFIYFCAKKVPPLSVSKVLDKSLWLWRLQSTSVLQKLLFMSA